MSWDFRAVFSKEVTFALRQTKRSQELRRTATQTMSGAKALRRAGHGGAGAPGEQITGQRVRERLGLGCHTWYPAGVSEPAAVVTPGRTQSTRSTGTDILEGGRSSSSPRHPLPSSAF